MAEAKHGDIVKVKYKGKFEDGIVFDSTDLLINEYMVFTIGAGQVLPGFENAVIGMKEGETKTVHLSAAKAYGAYDQEKVKVLQRTKLPPHVTPEIGVPLQVNLPSSQPVFVMVKKVTDTTVTIDANHPLSGKDLYYEIEFIEIVK